MSDKGPITSVDLSQLRTDYRQRSLTERDVAADPIEQFIAWFDEAVAAEVREPNAMMLATCTKEGVPSGRIVLLKGVQDGELLFFTNYLSQKGQELENNPQAALVFFWPELERQVRLVGKVRKTSAADSDAYFKSRPIASRIGAAASSQSRVIASREALEARFRELADQYPDGNVPRPKDWGGYRLRPRQAEFWQGRASRLHDRIQYDLDESSKWIIRRLAP